MTASHETLAVRTQDERRSRRYRVSSRVYFGYAIGLIEGLAAFLVSLACFWLGADFALSASLSGSAALAGVVGLAYGWSASRSAIRFMRLADPAQPFLLQAAMAWVISAGLASLVALLVAELPDIGQGFWVWLLAGGGFVIAVRLALYSRISALMGQGRFQIERIGLVGEKAAVESFRRTAQIWRQGAQVVTTLALDNDVSSVRPARDAIAAFARLCVDQHCDHVLLIGKLRDLDAFDSIVDPCGEYALDVVFSPLPSPGGAASRFLDLVPLGTANALRLMSRPLDDTARLVKRTMDIAGAGLGLVVLSPLLLLVAALIRIDSSGPALFRQERRGFNGRTFHIYKFRTMNVMEDGHVVQQAQVRDPRVTRIGAFLRRTSIDELPQLLNVLKGEMSLIGPRPHAISHDAELARKFAQYAFRQRIKPGISGWAQVNGYRGDTSTQQSIEGRTLHDLYYVENWSVSFDIWIVVLTLFSRRARQNAH